MNLAQVIRKMNLYTISAVRTNDLAVSANKLMHWDEKQWNIRPRLSTGANRKNLSKKELPLCLEISDEMSLALYLTRENTDNLDKQYLCNENDLTPINTFVATQIILFNYTLLEEYEFSQYGLVLKENILDLSSDKYTLKCFSNRGLNTLTEGALTREQNSYERKGVEKRVNDWGKINIPKISDENLEFYTELSLRRNELTHESEPKPPTLEEALTLFHCSRVIAKGIASSFSDDTLKDCKVFWDECSLEK